MLVRRVRKWYITQVNTITQQHISAVRESADKGIRTIKRLQDEEIKRAKQRKRAMLRKMEGKQ